MYICDKTLQYMCIIKAMALPRYHFYTKDIVWQVKFQQKTNLVIVMSETGIVWIASTLNVGETKYMLKKPALITVPP